MQKHILPVLILAAFVINPSARAQNKPASLGLNTICIDPGHGGKDPGCVSKDGAKEKDIVLSVGLKLKKCLNDNYPDLKVIMTRSDDRFIELNERAAIANRNNADLFISIHINAVDLRKNRNGASVSGFSIHTLGQSRTGADLYSSNMELCKRENSVILLENDYDTAYQGFNPNDPESYIIFNLMQNSNLVQSLAFADDVAANLSKGPVMRNRGISQDPFLVLWKTTMPAALIECGFITSTTDLPKIKTEKGQEDIARNIYNAVAAYKKEYDRSMNIAPVNNGSDDLSSQKKETLKDNAQTTPSEVKESNNSASPKKYGVQILATKNPKKPESGFFKGYEHLCVKNGELYKYYVSISDSPDEVKKNLDQVKKIFGSGFFAEIDMKILESKQ